MRERGASRRTAWVRVALVLLLSSVALGSSAALASAPRRSAALGAARLELAPLSLPLERDDVAGPGFALFAGDELGRALGPGARDRASRFTLGLAGEDLRPGRDVFGHEPPPGIPSLALETRIGASGLFLGTRIGPEARLTLGLHWGCGLSGCGIAEDQRKDPLGLQQELTPNLVEMQRSRNETVTALEQLGIAAGATRDLTTIALYMGPGIRDVLLTGEVIDAFERGDPLSVGPQVALRSLALLRYINLTRPESLAAIGAARRAGGGRVDVSELRVPRNPSAALEALDDAGDLRLASGSTGAATGAAARGAGKVTGLVQDAEGLKALGWIKPTPGEFAMVVHGTEKGQPLFKVLKRGGKAANPDDWLTVSHRQIATVMRKAGYRSGEKVRLYTCRGGACPTGIAQDLANKLGAEVEAPSDTLWVSRTGRTTIGPKPGVDTGHWEQFRPVRPAP